MSTRLVTLRGEGSVSFSSYVGGCCEGWQSTIQAGLQTLGWDSISARASRSAVILLRRREAPRGLWGSTDRAWRVLEEALRRRARVRLTLNPRRRCAGGLSPLRRRAPRRPRAARRRRRSPRGRARQACPPPRRGPPEGARGEARRVVPGVHGPARLSSTRGSITVEVGPSGGGTNPRVRGQPKLVQRGGGAVRDTGGEGREPATRRA